MFTWKVIHVQNKNFNKERGSIFKNSGVEKYK